MYTFGCACLDIIPVFFVLSVIRLSFGEIYTRLHTVFGVLLLHRTNRGSAKNEKGQPPESTPNSHLQ